MKEFEIYSEKFYEGLASRLEKIVEENKDIPDLGEEEYKKEQERHGKNN